MTAFEHLNANHCEKLVGGTVCDHGGPHMIT